MAEPARGPSLDELWFRTFQKITGQISHDFKGALNGVSVNLEVVRSRAEREGSPASDVQKFATTAVDQLGLVIRMSGALLSLGRSGKGPAEVTVVARQLVALIGDTLRTDGGGIEIQVDGGMSAETSASFSSVRLALGESLLGAVAGKGQVKVRVAAYPTPIVEIHPAPAQAISSEVMAALATAGIRIVDTAGHGISISFPGPTELPTEEA